jgi:hypothetical protein
VHPSVVQGLRHLSIGRARPARRFTWAAIGLLVFGLAAPAADRFHLSFAGAAAGALGDFRDNVPGAFGGLTMDFLFSPGSSPLRIGISGGLLIYGSESYTDFFPSRYADFEVDLTTDNSILLGHLLLRYEPGRGRWRPYLEGLAGLSHFRTDTSIDEYLSSDSGPSVNNLRNTVFSYGAGLGLTGRIVPWSTRVRRPDFELRLEIGLRYLRSGEVEYLTEGDITREGEDLVLNIRRSPTELVAARLGLAMRF